MTTKDNALRMAIARLEKSNFELQGIGNYSCQIYNDKTIETCKAALSEPVTLPDGLVSDERRMNYLSNGGWEVLQDPKYWTDELNLRQVIDRNIAAPTCEKEKG
jgi:hypothetical protein